MNIAQLCNLVRHIFLVIGLGGISWLLYYTPEVRDMPLQKQITTGYTKTISAPLICMPQSTIVIQENHTTPKKLPSKKINTESAQKIINKSPPQALSINTPSQTLAPIVDEATVHYQRLQNTPAYPTQGFKHFYGQIQKKIQYPKEAKKNQVQGIVFVQCSISSKGLLQNIKILQGIGSGCEEETIRLLKNMPHWFPAKREGVAIESKQILRIYFTL